MNAADLESCFVFVIVERLDKKTSLYILSNVGDQFCSVMQEEKKAFLFAGTDGKQGKPILFIHFINEEIALVSSFYRLNCFHLVGVFVY